MMNGNTSTTGTSISEEDMLRHGLDYFNAFKGTEVDSDRFVQLYGASAKTCAAIYNDLQLHDIPRKMTINTMNVRHFLMTFWWLHLYQTEPIVQVNFGIDSPTTVRKWIWAYCGALQELQAKKIVWNYLPSYPAPVFLLSVDGTHCPVEEQRKPHPDKKWYSHKFNGPGVSYSIAVNLIESRIEWVSGMYPAGNSDISIFRDSLKHKIPPGMLLVADKAFQGEACISVYNPLDTNDVKQFKTRAKARQEVVNKKFKEFKILDLSFRHPVHKHKIVFDAVCTIVQYRMELESKLFVI